MKSFRMRACTKRVAKRKIAKNKITTKGILEPEIDFGNQSSTKKKVAKFSEDAAVSL